MKALRVVGVAILRFLDALVPTVVAAVLAFLSVPYWAMDAVNPLLVAAGAAALAFVGTLTAGTVASLAGYGPFPATQAAKWLWHADGGILWNRRRR